MINYNSFQVNSPANNFSFYLSKLQKKLLNFYYELRLAGHEYCDYSLQELSIRFKRNPDYLSSQLSELEVFGLLGGEIRGCTSKRRWITCEGFEMLDNQQQGQTSRQIEATPNIYLSDQDLINYKIIKEEQTKEKVPEVPIENQLDDFLLSQNVSSQEIRAIKKALKSSPIGPVRRESVIRRVIACGKKKWIMDKKRYFLEAIRKEAQDLREFVKYLSNKKVSPVTYEVDCLNEVGCFT